MKIYESLSFPDHHRYTVSDLSRIFRAASKGGAEVIVTTAKDSVRIPPLYGDAFAVVQTGIDFGPDHESFCRLIRSRLGGS